MSLSHPNASVNSDIYLEHCSIQSGKITFIYYDLPMNNSSCSKVITVLNYLNQCRFTSSLSTTNYWATRNKTPIDHIFINQGIVGSREYISFVGYYEPLWLCHIFITPKSNSISITYMCKKEIRLKFWDQLVQKKVIEGIKGKFHMSLLLYAKWP